MTGIDSSEIILLLIIGLIVLGPKRLPEIANRVGSWIGQARRMTRIMKRQLEEELDLDRRAKTAKPTFSPPPVIGGNTSTDARGAAAEVQVPKDDGSYSPLHDAEAEDDETDAAADAGTENDAEKPA